MYTEESTPKNVKVKCERHADKKPYAQVDKTYFTQAFCTVVIEMHFDILSLSFIDVTQLHRAITVCLILVSSIV